MDGVTPLTLGAVGFCTPVRRGETDSDSSLSLPGLSTGGRGRYFERSPSMPSFRMELETEFVGEQDEATEADRPGDRSSGVSVCGIFTASCDFPLSLLGAASSGVVFVGGLSEASTGDVCA